MDKIPFEQIPVSQYIRRQIQEQRRLSTMPHVTYYSLEALLCETRIELLKKIHLDILGVECD